VTGPEEPGGGTVRSLCDRLSAGPAGAAPARTAPPRPPL